MPRAAATSVCPEGFRDKCSHGCITALMRSNTSCSNLQSAIKKNKPIKMKHFSRIFRNNISYWNHHRSDYGYGKRTTTCSSLYIFSYNHFLFLTTCLSVEMKYVSWGTTLPLMRCRRWKYFNLTPYSHVTVYQRCRKEVAFLLRFRAFSWRSKIWQYKK